MQLDSHVDAHIHFPVAGLPRVNSVGQATAGMNPTLKLITIHALAWVLYVCYESSILLIIDGFHFNWWEVVLTFAIYAIMFYVNSLYILPRFYIRKKYLLLVLSLLGLGVFLVVARYLVIVNILPYLDPEILYPFKNDKTFIAQTVWRGGYFTILSTGYFFANHLVRVERQRNELAEVRARNEQYLREMEGNLLKAEIINLKSQINPHFLYNSLNFFYSQIYPHSESTAKGILLLSDIMRYALKEIGGNGKVMLEDEIQHLRNYISMNKLRFNDRLQIKFDLIGNPSFRMIIPLVLITFVENCFKHGELFDPANPLLIRIEVTNEQLIFHTHNKKRSGTKEPSTGIGLANTKQRLSLMYPGNHSLTLTDGSDFYSCNLTIQL